MEYYHNHNFRVAESFEHNFRLNVISYYLKVEGFLRVITTYHLLCIFTSELVGINKKKNETRTTKTKTKHENKGFEENHINGREKCAHLM